MLLLLTRLSSCTAEALPNTVKFLENNPKFMTRHEHLFFGTCKGEEWKSDIDKVFCNVFKRHIRLCYAYYKNSGKDLVDLYPESRLMWYDAHLLSELKHIAVTHRFSGLYK